MARYIDTTWEFATYDVCGNAKDGYEVNDVYRRRKPIELRLKVDTYNPGTPQEFDGATPTDRQIRSIFGTRCRIDTEGDDTTIYVYRDRDRYPIGEIHCTSHHSLSPIRAASVATA